MERILQERGSNMGICCHPYNMCTELIAHEAGVVVTDAHGKRLDSLLTVDPNIAWVCYANASIQQLVEPLLQAALSKRGLI